MTRLVVAILAAVTVAVAATRQDSTRAPKDAVSTEVTVTDGGRPVEGLTAADFDLRDNGVPQRVDDVQPQSYALDISMILDVSGSVSGPLEDDLVEGARGIQKQLPPDDRTETIAVDREVRRTTDLHDWMAEAPPRIGDGGTRLFDAILTAVLERDVPGHRHVVVALTDGLDTGSVIDRATRLAVLGRSSAVVQMVAISLGDRRSGIQVHAMHGAKTILEEEGDYDSLLREIVDATGGSFYDIRPSASFAGELTTDLDRLRRSYALRYRPVGVAGPGWHGLAVTLTHATHDLRARSGYFGG